jgi:hypothetical protein
MVSAEIDFADLNFLLLVSTSLVARLRFDDGAIMLQDGIRWKCTRLLRINLVDL